MAVVGAGPAGLYVTDALVFQTAVPVRVDVFDRLPTPFGLLRYGVAPDHLKMKTLTRVLQKTVDHERVRFRGGVEVGATVTVEELRSAYHVVVYTFGASTDRRLGVPGEDLRGSASATDFVTWYSGHPDVPPDAFDLSTDAVASVVVVGVGNVAVDVARVLVKGVDALATTDIPTPVLDALRASRVRDVHVLGRRGPVQARFTHKELHELGELDGVDVVVDPADLELAGADEAELGGHPALQRNLDTMRTWADRAPTAAPRRLHLHFWSRPVALVGDGTGAVAAVRVEPTRLHDGALVAAGAPRDLAAGLVLRSVGYRGVALPGVPLDEGTGTVPAEEGRVLRDGAVSPGEYVAGWIGRGPVGVLGTNRSDATRLVQRLLADAPALLARTPERETVDDLLAARAPDLVDATGWAAIDAAEVAAGVGEGRARVKLASWDALHAAAVRSRP